MLLDRLDIDDEGCCLVEDGQLCVAHKDLEVGGLAAGGAVGCGDHVTVGHQGGAAALGPGAAAGKKSNLEKARGKG